MAYEVNFTDSVNKGSITVEDETVNTETSLQLPGRNLVDYGNKINENFLHLLENFASNVSPSNPVEGQLWYDNTTGVDQLKVYDGAAWVSAGGLKKASSQPAAEISNVGDLWIDTVNNQVYLYSGSGWILIGPENASSNLTGSVADTIESTENIEYSVIKNYSNEVLVSVVSSHNEFTPKLTIPGFSSIKPGINISTNISAKYWGAADKAENLVVSGSVIPGSSFARLDAQNLFTKGIRIRNNTGIDIGETQTLLLSITGSNAFITNKSTDGNIDLRTNSTTTAIRIKPDGKVGILNQSPQEALDVTGNIKASGTIVTTSITNSTSVSTGSIVTPGGVGIAQDLNVGGDVAVLGELSTTNLLPDVDGTRNIGDSGNVYNNVYANNFRGNLIGDVVGSISGSATTAGKLSSATTFRITGDISSTADITFDGQVGGLTKTFNTTLDDSFFTGKTAYTDNVSGTEQVLIRKTTTLPTDAQPVNTFYKTTVEDLVSIVPTFQVGMIMPYAGTTAPRGWRLCNGDAISLTLTDYELLFTVIGYTYGGSVGVSFNLPDLRGRFALGKLDGETRTLATDEDRVYDDGAADILGADGGAQRRYITQDKLPEHQHDLLGDDGTQFYATTNVTGGSDSNSTGINSVGGDPGTGLTVTEGVTGLTTSTQTVDGLAQEVGEKFTTVPPYLTINYIIYTGVV